MVTLQEDVGAHAASATAAGLWDTLCLLAGFAGMIGFVYARWGLRLVGEHNSNNYGLLYL